MPKHYERIVKTSDIEKASLVKEENTKLVNETHPEYGEIRIPTAWTNPPALTDLKHDIEGAMDDHDLIVTEINEHLDYYHTTPGVGRPHKVKGRSNAQPQSIRKAAEWKYPTLSEPFLDNPEMFKGQPTTYQDAEGTKEAVLMLNYQFQHKIDAVTLIDDMVKDAVDTGTAIVKTSWDLIERKKEVDREIVKYVHNPELKPVYTKLMIMLGQDRKKFEEAVPDGVKLALQKSLQDGKTYERKVLGTERVEVSEIIENKPDAEVCDYRDVIPDPTCRGKQDKMRFCGYRFRTTKADLAKDPRYFNVDDIVVASSSVIRQDALDMASEDMDQDSDTFQFKDPNRQPIEGIEYWGFVDVDDSGILTPVVYTWFGDVLVRAEENPYPDKKIPFTFIPLLKKRNSLYGEPDGAILIEDQKISGAITRGVIDTLAKNANGQRGIPKGALDYSNYNLYLEGKDYEYNPTVAIGMDGITQVTKFPEIPQSALAIQQLSEANIKEFTGTIQGQGSTNHGNNLGTQLDLAPVGGMSKAARRELAILRRLSKGLLEVGKKICAMNVEFLEDEEYIRVTDSEYTTIHRNKLDCDYDLTLSISTAEDDATKAQELAFMLQTSTGVMDQAFVRELLADIADLRRMPDKARKYREFAPQPDPKEEQIKDLQIMKLEAEIEEIRARTQENLAEAQRETANAEKFIADANLANSKADAIDLKFMEDETGVTHKRDLEKQMAQSKGNMDLESHKADLDERRATRERAENTGDSLTEEGETSTTAPTDELDIDFESEQFENELERISNSDNLL